MEQKIISFDGSEIYYQHHKGKKDYTLTFLHGVGANWTVWKKELNFFKKKGFSTLVIDLRGHGQSSSPLEFEKYRLYHFSRDLRQILTQEKINDFSLIGHSLGGGVALSYCLHYPKKLPSSLVLIETSTTFPFKHNRLLNMGPYITHFLRFIASHKLTNKEHFFHFKDIDLSFTGMKENWKLISHLIHITPIRSLVKALDNLERFVFKNHHRIDTMIKNFPNPVLLIAGGRDKVVPPEYVHLVQKLNHNAKYHLFRKAGHKVIMDDAEKVSKVVYNFLNENLKN